MPLIRCRDGRPAIDASAPIIPPAFVARFPQAVENYASARYLDSLSITGRAGRSNRRHVRSHPPESLHPSPWCKPPGAQSVRVMNWRQALPAFPFPSARSTTARSAALAVGCLRRSGHRWLSPLAPSRPSTPGYRELDRFSRSRRMGFSGHRDWRLAQARPLLFPAPWYQLAAIGRPVALNPGSPTAEPKEPQVCRHSGTLNPRWPLSQRRPLASQLAIACLIHKALSRRNKRSARSRSCLG